MIRFIDKREAIKAEGNIFENIKNNMRFEDLITMAARNTKKTNKITYTNKHYEGEVKKLLRRPDINTLSKLLAKEREELLKHYVSNRLTPENVSLGIHLVPKSLDAQDFIDNFNYDNCPHLAAYTEFQARRYMDKGRSPKGDLADIEHAIHGAFSCDQLVIEKNAGAILGQMRGAGYKIKAKIFHDLQEAIDYLKV